MAIVVPAVLVLALGGCSWLPQDPGPPTIPNAHLAEAGWTDSCVVGTWRLTRASTTVELGDATLELTSTGQRVFTATPDGLLEIQFPGDGLAWHGSSDSLTVDGSVTGSATGTYEAVMGEWSTVVDNSQSYTTVLINGERDGPAPGGSAETNIQGYFCSDDELVISSATSRQVYVRE